MVIGGPTLCPGRTLFRAQAYSTALPYSQAPPSSRSLARNHKIKIDREIMKPIWISEIVDSTGITKNR